MKKLKKIKKLHRLKNPCAVVALCYASKTTAKHTLKVCKDNGYEGEGMDDEEWQTAAEELGIKIKKVKMKKKLIKEFVKKFTSGMYLVWTFNHIFVIHDGKVIDPLSGPKPTVRRILVGAAKVL